MKKNNLFLYMILIILSLLTLGLALYKIKREKDLEKKMERYSFLDIVTSPIKSIGRMVSGFANSISSLINILVTTDASKLALGSYVSLYLAYNSLSSDPFSSFNQFMKVIGMIKNAGNKKVDDFNCPDDPPGFKKKCEQLLKDFTNPDTVAELERRLYANKVKNASQILKAFYENSADLKSLPKLPTQEDFGRIIRKTFEKAKGRKYTIGPYFNQDMSIDAQYWDEIFKKFMDTGVVDSPPKLRNYITKEDDGCKEDDENISEKCFTPNFIFWRDFLNFFVDEDCPDSDSICTEYNDKCIDPTEENEDRCRQLKTQKNQKYPSGLAKGKRLIDIYMLDYRYKQFLGNLIQKYKNYNLSDNDLFQLINLIIQTVGKLELKLAPNSIVSFMVDKLNKPFIEQDLFALANEDFEKMKAFLDNDSNQKMIDTSIGKILSDPNLTLDIHDDWFWNYYGQEVKISNRKPDGTFNLDMIKDGKPIPTVLGMLNKDGSVIIKTPAGQYKSPGLTKFKSYELQGPGMIISLFPKIQ